MQKSGIQAISQRFDVVVRDDFAFTDVCVSWSELKPVIFQIIFQPRQLLIQALSACLVTITALFAM